MFRAHVPPLHSQDGSSVHSRAPLASIGDNQRAALYSRRGHRAADRIANATRWVASASAYSHSAARVVVSDGPAGSIRPQPETERGDRVGVYYLFSCSRRRYCLAGEVEACLGAHSRPRTGGITRDGGCAQLMKVPADYALPLPPELDFVTAAPLLCAGLTVYTGFKNTRLGPGERAAVWASAALDTSSSLSREQWEPKSSRSLRRRPRRNMPDSWAPLTSSAERGAAGQRLLEQGGANVVLSSALDPQAIAHIPQGIAPQGALLLTGVTADPLPIVPPLLTFGQQRVIGSVIGSRNDLRELLQLAVHFNIRSMTELFPLAAVNEVHARLRTNQVRFRAVLIPE